MADDLSQYNRWEGGATGIFLSSAGYGALGHASPARPLNVRIAMSGETVEIEIAAVERHPEVECRFYG